MSSTLAGESPIPVPQTPSTFPPHARRNAFRHRDARLQSRSFAGWRSTAETQPKLQPDFLRLSAMVSQYFMTVKWLGLEWPARDARNKLARNEAKRSKPMLE